MKKLKLLLSLTAIGFLSACSSTPAVSSSSSHEHQYDAVFTNPTCTEKGYTTHTCSCGDTYIDEYIDALGHAFYDYEAKEATCTEAGWNAYQTCLRCDYSSYEEIPAKGHAYGEWVVDKEMTCTEDGSRHKVCASCGDRVDEKLVAPGHDITQYEAKAPTCVDVGWDAYEACSRCSYSTKVEIPATGVHTEDNWVTIKEATCTEAGIMHQVCSVCGYIVSTATPPALRHNIVQYAAKAPTCGEVGWEAYEACSRCDYSTKVEIPATGDHSYGDWIIDKAATCVAAGTRHKECSNCDTIIEEAIAATGVHNYGDWIVDKEATCLEEGQRHKECLDCDDVIEEATTGDHHYVGKACSVCAIPTPNGELTEFGSYPQTEVKDASLIATLDGLTPDSGGYVTSGDTKYLKTVGSGNNGYDAATTYYFEVEPIEWKYYDGMLISEKIIDASLFYTNNAYRDGDTALVHPNNYKHSIARAYLNGLDERAFRIDDFTGIGFVDKAFSEEEQGMIASSTVDNSAADADSSVNDYACADTSDKIFLPSYQDAINATYGYSTNYKDDDAARVKAPTDYAKFQGCSYYSVTGNGRYWLRTPYSGIEHNAWYVAWDGILLHSEISECFGLAPALNLS